MYNNEVHIIYNIYKIYNMIFIYIFIIVAKVPGVVRRIIIEKKLQNFFKKFHLEKKSYFISQFINHGFPKKNQPFGQLPLTYIQIIRRKIIPRTVRENH